MCLSFPFVAKMALNVNDVKKAINVCETALRSSHGSSFAALTFLGPILLQHGYYQQAVEVYQRLLSSNRIIMTGVLVDWLSCLGYSLLVCGDSTGSFAAFQQALRYESSKYVRRVLSYPFLLLRMLCYGTE